MKIKFRLLFYAIVLTIYIFLPGIVQQIFMNFDEYLLLYINRNSISSKYLLGKLAV